MTPADVLLDDTPEQVEAPVIPDYILNACEAAAEWWAKSDQDPRIKFQPAVVMRLLMAIREGSHYEPACAVAGVSYRQFREWMNKAEDEDETSPYARVASAVKVAESEAELESVRYVRAASRDPRFWAAGMTFLERRHPDRWKRPDSAAAVQVNVGIAVGIQASDEARKGFVPQVVIEQIANGNGVAPPLGTELVSAPTTPTFASGASLSPVPRNG